MLIPLQLLIVCHYRRRQHDIVVYIAISCLFAIVSSYIIIVISANDCTASIPLLLCDVYLVCVVLYHRKHHRLSGEPLSTTTTITLQYISNFANHIVGMMLTSSSYD